MPGRIAKERSIPSGNDLYSSITLFHSGRWSSFFVHNSFLEIRNYRLYLDKTSALYEISIRLELF